MYDSQTLQTQYDIQESYSIDAMPIAIRELTPSKLVTERDAMHLS